MLFKHFLNWFSVKMTISWYKITVTEDFLCIVHLYSAHIEMMVLIQYIFSLMAPVYYIWGLNLYSKLSFHSLHNTTSLVQINDTLWMLSEKLWKTMCHYPPIIMCRTSLWRPALNPPSDVDHHSDQLLTLLPSDVIGQPVVQSTNYFWAHASLNCLAKAWKGKGLFQNIPHIGD